MRIQNLGPRPAPLEHGVEAPVHILGLQGASVVIVDDQETARVALDEMIRGIDPGISTSLFPGGVEALEWLEHQEPDLVITDFPDAGDERSSVHRGAAAQPATAACPGDGGYRRR